MEHSIGKFSAVGFQSFLIMVYIFCYIPCICEFCCIVISYCSVFTALEFLVVLVKLNPCLYSVRKIPCNDKFEGPFFSRLKFFPGSDRSDLFSSFQETEIMKLCKFTSHTVRYGLFFQKSITGKVIPEILYSIHPFAVKPLCFIGYFGSTGQNRHVSIP